jgi:CheY-like chemotaxis protein
MTDAPVLVLLVEDNEDHAELVQRTLLQVDRHIRIVHVRDGEAALDYLGLSGRPAADLKRERPGLVLLDLRLPRIDGLDVLRRIKDAVALRPMPVVVLTTSIAAQDVSRAYEYHANSYLAKPVSFDRFNRMMKDLSRYWTVWNAAPSTQE